MLSTLRKERRLAQNLERSLSGHLRSELPPRTDTGKRKQLPLKNLFIYLFILFICYLVNPYRKFRPMCAWTLLVFGTET